MDKDMVCKGNEIFNHEKKWEILPFTTTWMDLEGIKLSEVSQRQTPWYHLHVKSETA